MKIIVTHKSPDLDAVTSVWLIKRFFPGWQDAVYHFVPAGEKMQGNYEKEGEAVEVVGGYEVIHVDTGLGALDHHQTQDDTVSAASLTFDYIRANGSPLKDAKLEAIERMVTLVVADDHFKEIFYPDAIAFHHDFSLRGIIDGYRAIYPDDFEKVTEFSFSCLDAALHTFEARIWAEREIEEKGIEFETKWGKALAVDTINDEVLKLGQIMGYTIVVRKDPNHGFVRIKARPDERGSKMIVDLTPVRDVLTEKDPDATWFLHISKKMLLNGSAKNPESVPTKLPITDIIQILKSIK